MVQAVTGRISLSVLLETLEDANTMGVEDSDLKHRLQERADRAQALEQQAAACLTAVQEALPGGTRVALADLEALVQEGHTIGIKMDSLTELLGLVSSAKAWDQQAEFCLTGHKAQHAKRGKVQTPTLATVTELLQQHASLAIAVPHAQALFEKQQAAVSWLDSAVKALEHRNLQQHLPEVQAIVDSGLALNLQMPELTQLDSLVRAIHWNIRVRRALGLPQSSPGKPGSTTPAGPAELPAQHGNSSEDQPCATSAGHLRSAESGQVDTQPQALQMAGVSSEPMQTDESSAKQSHVATAHDARMNLPGTQHAPPTAAMPWVAAPGLAGPAEVSPQLHSSNLNLSSGAEQAAAPAAVQQPGHLTQFEAQLDDGNEMLPQVPTQPDVDSEMLQQLPTASWQDQVTLAEAEQLVEEGQQLPVEETLLHQLHTLLQIGQHWQVQVSLCAVL